MSDTLDLSELTLQESGNMDNYEENGFEEPELQLEASAHEPDEASEPDDSLSRVNSLSSGGSLEPEQGIYNDEHGEIDEEDRPIATVSTEDDNEQDDKDLQDEDGAFHAQEEELDQVEGDQVGPGNTDDVKVAPKKSAWLTRYFQRQEELY